MLAVVRKRVRRRETSKILRQDESHFCASCANSGARLAEHVDPAKSGSIPSVQPQKLLMQRISTMELGICDCKSRFGMLKLAVEP